MPNVSGDFRQILRQKQCYFNTENLLKGIIHSTLLHRTPNWHEHCDRLLIPGLDYFLTHFSELFPQSHSSSSFSFPCCTFFVQPSFWHEQCRKAAWGHGDKQKNGRGAALLEKFPLGKLFRWHDRQRHVRIQTTPSSEQHTIMTRIIRHARHDTYIKWGRKSCPCMLRPLPGRT